MEKETKKDTGVDFWTIDYLELNLVMLDHSLSYLEDDFVCKMQKAKNA